MHVGTSHDLYYRVTRDEASQDVCEVCAFIVQDKYEAYLRQAEKSARREDYSVQVDPKKVKL